MWQREDGHRPRRLTYLGAGLLLLACLVAGLTFPLGKAAAADEPYVVVVHGSNPTGPLKRVEVSNLFLKKTTAWAGGTRVAPVDLMAPASLREAFCKKIHGRGAAAVKSYWQQMIFSGREVPPLEANGVAQVLSFVRADRGAIGYVPAGTALGSGLKELEVIP
jgi:hypothetical protein